ncbi:hypothetical protein WDU94_015412 [Cyamophila willieti]
MTPGQAPTQSNENWETIIKCESSLVETNNNESGQCCDVDRCKREPDQICSTCLVNESEAHEVVCVNGPSDEDNACSLVLLNNVDTDTHDDSNIDDDDDECMYNVEKYSQYNELFKKCSNYKKPPNEYVNHNIRRNKLRVRWTSNHCAHLEWNIVDQVSPQDWIGLYELGKMELRHSL